MFYSPTIHSLVLTAVLCLAFLVAVPGYAYQTEPLPSTDVFGDFVVGPGRMNIEIAPGESKTVNLLLSNRMGDDREFEVVVEDMKGSDDPTMTVILLGEERGPYSIRDYISVPKKRFLLEHATRAAVPVTISVPVDAEPGGYYGSVLFTTASKPREDTEAGVVGGAAIVSRIGVLFFVTVPGTQEFDGALESFTTRGDQQVFTTGAVTFQTLFRNNGTVHLNPSATLTIKNMLGAEVERIEVEPWFALPQSLRSREIVWDRPRALGKYEALITVDRGYDGLRDVKSVTYWVVPVVPAPTVLAAVFVVFFALRLLTTRFEIRRKT